MTPKSPSDFGPDQASDLYGIDGWGAGYFGISPEGDMTVRVPGEDPVSLKAMVDELREQGLSLPLILRFPQILEDRLALLNGAFQEAIEESGFEGSYQGVYPIKVNQKQRVVETIAESGVRYRTGLEAGSKAELALILVQDVHDEALICCNGFKDDHFVRMALWGRKLGKNVVITLEKFAELDRVLRIAKELEIEPAIGVRYKLHAKGSGKWEQSGGDHAKFGLNTAELLQVAMRLKQHGLEASLKMLHCHLGSQMTDIRRIKKAVREATQTYVELQSFGVPVEYLNLGGGLAVDYDGSKTTFHASANYGVVEYADTIVWTAKEVCDEGKAPHPILVTESGRALTAHHAVFVVPILDTIRPALPEVELPEVTGDYHEIDKDMRELYESVGIKNYREVYHEAVSHKDTMHSLYDLGYLSLVERARVEALYSAILIKIQRLIDDLDYVPEEFERLPQILAHKYIGNFSVFQAIPDHWAIQALFPIAPLHRLNQEPSIEATLVDISCDSDGKVTHFVDLRDVRHTLPLHPFETGQDYYLGLFLTGAYQDVLANSHNLFGRVNEAHIRLQEGGFTIQEAVPGQQARRVIENMGYETQKLHRWLLETIAESEVTLPKGQKRRFVDLYDSELVGTTYLVEDEVELAPSPPAQELPSSSREG